MMFKSSSFAALLTAALFCSGVSAQGPVSSVSCAATSKCLQVRGSNFVDGTAVEQYDCNNSSSQQWEVFSGLTEVVLANQNLPTQFCVDAKDVDNSSPAVIVECNQDASQQWIFTDDGLFTLANNTNLCLEVPNSSADNGVQVQTSPCNGGLNQVWNLI